MSIKGRARLPLLPTLVTLIAVPLMVWAGFWQLDRRAEKRLALVAFEHPAHVTAACLSPRGPVREAVGIGPGGQDGWAHRFDCGDGAGGLLVDMGWSARPVRVRPPAPGTLTGTLYRIPDSAPLLILAAPAPPLLPSQAPAAEDIPNNHLSYTIQWFAFALTLTVIYTLYVRRWRRERDDGRA